MFQFFGAYFQSCRIDDIICPPLPSEFGGRDNGHDVIGDYSSDAQMRNVGRQAAASICGEARIPGNSVKSAAVVCDVGQSYMTASLGDVSVYPGVCQLLPSSIGQRCTAHDDISHALSGIRNCDQSLDLRRHYCQ